MTKTIKECKKHGLCEHYEYARKNRPSKGLRCCKCNTEAVTRKRKQLKIAAIAYLGGKCEHCGLKEDCPDIYDFHHKDSKEKDFGISAKGNTKSWEKMKKELDKCMLLCANCHRREHYKLRLE